MILQLSCLECHGCRNYATSVLQLLLCSGHQVASPQGPLILGVANLRVCQIAQLNLNFLFCWQKIVPLLGHANKALTVTPPKIFQRKLDCLIVDLLAVYLGFQAFSPFLMPEVTFITCFLFLRLCILCTHTHTQSSGTSISFLCLTS